MIDDQHQEKKKPRNAVHLSGTGKLDNRFFGGHFDLESERRRESTNEY